MIAELFESIYELRCIHCGAFEYITWNRLTRFKNNKIYIGMIIKCNKCGKENIISEIEGNEK